MAYMPVILVKCLVLDNFCMYFPLINGLFIYFLNSEVPNIPVCTFLQKGACVIPQNGKHYFHNPCLGSTELSGK